ncbi:MAG: Flp family type IVb pilin [Xanthobacteraceae bacterium]
MVTRFIRSDSGTTAIEYAIIADGIALAIIAAVQGVGHRRQERFCELRHCPEIVSLAKGDSLGARTLFLSFGGSNLVQFYRQT